MVGVVRRVEKFCKSGRGALQKSSNKKREQGDRKLYHFFKKQDEKSEQEEERKKKIMKERNKLRIWDPGWGNQIRVQIMGDSNLVVDWMNGR